MGSKIPPGKAIQQRDEQKQKKKPFLMPQPTGPDTTKPVRRKMMLHLELRMSLFLF